jgi:DNA helicase-2/ATP-dependent DNA helicase PcrA
LVEGIATRTAVEIAKFVALVDRLGVEASGPVEHVLGLVLSETGYLQMLEQSEDEKDQDRLGNLKELLSAARQFDEHNPGGGHLEEFLENVCLVSDTDAFEETLDRVTLMTLHSAKGLEFPVVFLAGLEEGLIPHKRSQGDDNEMEEERRLLFVGITRAREELHLSRAYYRDFQGNRRMTVPSRFLMELPREEMDVDETTWQQAVELHTHSPHIDEHETVWEADASEVESSQSAAPARGERSYAVTTAAALCGDTTTVAEVSPDVFYQGMVVTHPEYGLGKIIALSGSERNRRATVAFATAGQKTFVLSASPLQPASAK